MAEPQAYEKTRDEIRQVLEIADARWLEGKLEGALQAAARSRLTVLRARGIVVPEGAHARISAERDLATLERWLERATSVSSIDAAFGEAT